MNTSTTPTAPIHPLADDSLFEATGYQKHLVRVTPEIAERWLSKRNYNNRTLSKIHAEKLLSDIRAGRWHFTADPIKFDDNGRLLDGQHRLSAISMLDPSDSVLLEVAVGLDPVSQNYMDQARSRALSDQLHLNGVKNATHVGAVFRNLIVLDKDGVFREWEVKTISKSEALEYALRHRDEIDFINQVHSMVRGIDIPNSILATFLVFAHRAYPEEVVEFLTQLHDLLDLKSGDPAHTVNKSLQTIRKGRERVNSMTYMAMLLYAFNAYVDGRRINQIKRTGWTVETFPKLATRS